MQPGTDPSTRFFVGAVLLCGAVLAGTVAWLAVPALMVRVGWAPTAPPTYVRGEAIDVSADVYSPRAFTLIVFARHDCGACQDAKPILANLATDLRSFPRAGMEVITGKAPPDQQRQFVAELGLDPSHLWSVDTTHLKVRAVPALALVDQRGRVLFARDGIPTEDDRARIVQTVKAGS